MEDQGQLLLKAELFHCCQIYKPGSTMHCKYSYQSNMIYKPLEFFQINEAPHEILENSIDNIPTFQENNVLFALDHWPKLEV